MENKSKTKFENVGLLKEFLAENKISNLVGNIRSLKVKMDSLCKSARVREKELKLQQQKEIEKTQVMAEVKQEVKVEVQPVVLPTPKTEQKPVEVKKVFSVMLSFAIISFVVKRDT